jgi:hypothetical protein
MSVYSNHLKTREEKFRNVNTLNMDEILDSVQNNYSAVNSKRHNI